MTSSGPQIQGARITEDYPTLFGDSYETAETYVESTPLFDCICYPYPAFDHLVSSLQEADYNGNQLSYSGGANWLSNYDSGFGGCWGENLFSYNYSTDGKEYCVRKEDPRQNVEHYEIDFSYHEDKDNQPAFDYNTCYDSCSAYIEEIFNYSELEPSPAYGSSMEEMGFCEGIFGYWPCLLREMRLNYQS